MTRSKECPACREMVDEAKRNAILNNIIETYLKGHPEEIRPEEELKELEEKNVVTMDRMRIRSQ